MRGEVVEAVSGQEARDHLDELSRKNHDEDYPRQQHKRAGGAVGRLFPLAHRGPGRV